MKLLISGVVVEGIRGWFVVFFNYVCDCDVVNEGLFIEEDYLKVRRRWKSKGGDIDFSFIFYLVNFEFLFCNVLILVIILIYVGKMYYINLFFYCCLIFYYKVKVIECKG